MGKRKLKVESSKLKEQGPCDTVTLTLSRGITNLEWIGLDALIREAIERAEA